jgi:hypothetical protein
MILSDYKDIEYCITQNNSVIQQARKLLNAYSIIRAEAEDKRYDAKEKMAIVANMEKRTHMCCNCSKHGNKTKYDKSTMLEVSRPTMRNHRQKINKNYLCPACAFKYKPQSQRAGGRDG